MSERSSSVPIQRRRREVAPCYGHLKGVLAERLMHWLVEQAWIVVERQGDHAQSVLLTAEGRNGLARWGVEVEHLETNRRKDVTICSERLRGETYEHVGAHLGTLLREWLERQGMVTLTEHGLELTAAGREALRATGALP